MSHSINRSKELFERARQSIPGGVNSPVRAFKSVGGTPLFFERSEGCYLFDVDGNRYIDFVGSWGPLILGNRHPAVLAAIERALSLGSSFGAPTELEVQLAERVISLVPGVEMVRMVNSGTEATMSAIRLARAFTKRDLLLKFDGCYHGHADSLLVAAGSGVATLGIAGSPGVPEDVAALTVSIEYNDLELLETTLSAIGAERVAAIIVEPVAGNMGLVLPEPGFLEGLRRIADHERIVLIFDEVMTGFRVAAGGASVRFGVTPDLWTFGKIIGGGLPVGAYGGRKELMTLIAPSGPVYQAGTLSGNPLAMAAGLATLDYLAETNIYPSLEEASARVAEGFVAAAQAHGVPCVGAHCGAMTGFFLSESPVKNFTQAKRADTALFSKLFHAALAEGVYLAPSPFETNFLSVAHTSNVIDQAITAMNRAFERLVR